MLFFSSKPGEYFDGSIEVHRKLGLPLEQLDGPQLQRRFPMIDFSGVIIGLYEPEFGALMARRSVQTLITLVVGEEAGDRRNPRRNHMLRRILRGDDSSSHAQSGSRPVPGVAAAHDEALAEVQGSPIQQGDGAGRGLPYLRW